MKISEVRVVEIDLDPRPKTRPRPVKPKYSGTPTIPSIATIPTAS